MPRASVARDVLPLQLVDMGATVDEVPAYQTIKPDKDKGRIMELLKRGEIDMVTFTSSSPVANFLEMFVSEKNLLMEYMRKVAVACIGPITAQTAREKGLTVSVIPSEYTIESLTDSICDYFLNH